MVVDKLFGSIWLVKQSRRSLPNLLRVLTIKKILREFEGDNDEWTRAFSGSNSHISSILCPKAYFQKVYFSVKTNEWRKISSAWPQTEGHIWFSLKFFLNNLTRFIFDINSDQLLDPVCFFFFSKALVKHKKFHCRGSSRSFHWSQISNW